MLASELEDCIRHCKELGDRRGQNAHKLGMTLLPVCWVKQKWRFLTFNFRGNQHSRKIKYAQMISICYEILYQTAIYDQKRHITTSPTNATLYLRIIL